MGHQLDRLGTGALPDRQPIGPTRFAVCVSFGREWRARPALSLDCPTRSLGTAGAAQVFERAWAKPITFDSVYVGLQRSAATLVTASNQPVSFAARRATTVAPGLSVWSDAVSLPFVHDPAAPEFLGRKLAVSFHIAGESGPMTWHAKALTTSYLTVPGAGAKGAAEDEQDFPFSTASWYFLDALDMMAPAEAHTIVAFGDSITDGTASTMNGDDRWPDVLARRLHVVYGNKLAVVNAGIGGNQVVGPAKYSPQEPFPGGPSAKDRLHRDVLSLSGVAAVI
jgi:hypothetical protein